MICRLVEFPGDIVQNISWNSGPYLLVGISRISNTRPSLPVPLLRTKCIGKQFLVLGPPELAC